ALGGLPERELRRLGGRIAGALEAIHKLGYVHGDLKPENILFDDQGQAFLVDMGFAAPIGSAFSERGTPGYLPPEYLGPVVWSPASDLFALGVSLYAAATGEHPVPAALAQADHAPVLQAFSRRDTRRPSRRAAALSPAMDQWLAWSLDPKPTNRPKASESVAFFASEPPWSMVPEPRLERENPWSGALRLPFAGRTEELKWIGSLWHSVLEQSHPCLVVVRSPQSGGGSRFLSEAARRARRQRVYPTLLAGRVNSFQEERPGHALRGMVRQWLALPPHAAPRPEDRDRLFELLPPSEAQALWESLDPAAQDSPRAAESKALIAFFARLAARGPLWIQLDDADFAGRATLEPLERLAQVAAHLPLMVVLGMGPHVQKKSQRALAALTETWKLHGRAERIELGPLTRPAILEYVRATFVPSQASRELAEVLHQRTEGHPGRLRELLRTLEAQGRMLPKGDRYALSIEPSAIPMPPSQVEALSNRYSMLSQPERIWLVRFAIAGGNLDPQILSKAFAVSAGEVEYQLARFVRNGWLERSAAGARFRRPQVRRALIRAIPPERSKRLHRDLAAALAQEPGKPIALGLAFEEAWHLREGGDAATLSQRLPRLIRSMQRSGHPSRMLLLARWGLEAERALAQPPGRQTFVYRILGAQAAHELGKRKEEEALLSQVLDLPLDPHKDSLRLGLLYLQMGRFHAATSSMEKALEFLRNARQAFQRAGAIEREAEALLDYGKLCAALGDWKEAHWAVDAASALDLQSPEAARVFTLRGALALLEDDLEGSLRYLNRAKRKLAGDTRRRAKARSAEAELIRSRCYRLLGRPRRAWVSLRLAERLAAFAGERTLEIDVLVRRGRLLTEFGRESEAELDLREGLRLAEAIDDRRSRARATILLGILLAERDQSEGSRLLHKALSLAQEYHLPRLEALASTLCARLALRRGQLERAQAL
ncbi:MAG TPA: protein kinase, partial [Planctomycetota bacterium]|nr:protein kinase [Planctomycetota bacterium]